MKRAIGVDEDATIALKPFPAPPTLADQLTQLLRGAGTSAAAARLDALPSELRALHTLATELPAGAPLLIAPGVVVLR